MGAKSVLEVTNRNSLDTFDNIDGYIATSRSTWWDRLKTGTLFRPISLTISKDVPLTQQEIKERGFQFSISVSAQPLKYERHPELPEGGEWVKGTETPLVPLDEWLHLKEITIKRSQSPEAYREAFADFKEIREQWEWQQTQPEPSPSDPWLDEQRQWYETDDDSSGKRWPGPGFRAEGPGHIHE